MKFIYISDAVGRNYNGGAEQNDSVLLHLLEKNGHTVISIASDDDNIMSILKNNPSHKIIVSNFVFMFKRIMKYIEENRDYMIYEHDHKYLITRDPSHYENYTAPSEEKQHLEFYRTARSVFCQSSLHKSIVERNIDGVEAFNVSGNLWSHKTLDMIEEFSGNKKEDKYFIMKSGIEHKNTFGCIKYCESTDKPYVVVGGLSHEKFLEEMSKYKTLFFIPQTIETLSRIVVEARMMNCNVLTNNNVGAAGEDWFALKGSKLIKEMKNKHIEVVSKIEEVFSK